MSHQGARKQARMGSVVEFSPATREARVRFPVRAYFFFNDRRTHFQALIKK